jgi:medium-chain acyl-[acyl-carrier-protein] hydrolase
MPEAQPIEDPRRRLVRSKLAPNAPARLIAFPYAGAGAVAYHPWGAGLAPDIEVASFQYRGRGALSGLAPHTTLAGLVDDVIGALADLGDKPFYFFGHSMGGIVAFEAARRLQSLGIQGPKALILSACSPPLGLGSGRKIHLLPDAEFLAELVRFGGMRPEILSSPDMLAFIVPVVRADLQALETWQPADRSALYAPILALGGTNDAIVPMHQLSEWHRFTRGDFEARALSGGHFYFQDDLPSFWALLKSYVAQDLRGRSRRAEPG